MFSTQKDLGVIGEKGKKQKTQRSLLQKPKIGGNLSVRDMALSGIRRMSMDEAGIPGYEFNAEVRFNFNNKSFKIRKEPKKETYLDILMKQKAKIPPPDKYTGQGNMNQVNKKFKIYIQDNKMMWDGIIAKAKKTPGPNFYNNTSFDEKRIKPPRGVTNKLTAQRQGFIDDAKYLAE